MSKNLYPNSVRIGLMDPSIAQIWAQRILSDGTTVGSIKKGDTINHTTSQPIATGLFCQRIFGPCTDYTCACGHEKIRIVFNPNISPPVCPECRVEWTHASVRRQFLGSIELISPVTHKWFSDSRGAYIPTLLGITPRTFRNVKECKLFFPFSFEKAQDFIKYKKKNNLVDKRVPKTRLSTNPSFISQNTGSKPQVSINFRAMHTLQLLIDPKKSLKGLQTVGLHQLQVTENSRSFWVLLGPFGLSLKGLDSKNQPSFSSLLKMNNFFSKTGSKFSDVCKLINVDKTNIGLPISSNEIQNIKTHTLGKNQLFNRKNKALYSNFITKTQEIINQQEKCPKKSNFSSLIDVAQWLTIEQKYSHSTPLTQVLSSKKLPKPLNNLEVRSSSKNNFYTYMPSIEGNEKSLNLMVMAQKGDGRGRVQRTRAPEGYRLSELKSLERVEVMGSSSPSPKDAGSKGPTTITPFGPYYQEEVGPKDPTQSFGPYKPKPFFQKLSSKTVYPNTGENQPSKRIVNTAKQLVLLKKETLKYVLVLAQKKANKPNSSREENKRPLTNWSDNLFFQNIKNSKTIDTPQKKLKSGNFSPSLLQEKQSSIFDFQGPKPFFTSSKILIKQQPSLLSLNSTYIFRDFTKYQKKEMFEVWGYKKKKSGIHFSSEIISKIKGKMTKYKIGLNAKSKIGLFLTKGFGGIEKPLGRVLRTRAQKGYGLSELKSFGPYYHHLFEPIPFRTTTPQPPKEKRESSKSPQPLGGSLPLFSTSSDTLLNPSFNGYHNLPIRPSYTQSEDYRRQFFKFYGNSSIKKTDIPIFRYILGFRNTNRQTQTSIENRLTKKKTKTSVLSSQAIEVYFSEAKSVAKEQTIKKILSQTGGGGLQTYLGLINLSELVLILQNDLLEIAPRLSRSYATRRVLLSIINDFSTQNLMETGVSTPVHDIFEVFEKKSKQIKKEYKAVKKILCDFQNRKNVHKRRYKLAFQLLRTMSNPAGMTMSSVPVLPPGLRPIIDVPKIGPITADLNIRYRSLLFALRNLRELAIVDFRNAGAAQASVQEAVDDLLYTGGKTRREKPSSYPNLYKSLAMRLKGKHGRFRGNLLGKRVDYSGRSVIVVGPTLKIHQCGLPFEIAIKLFNPFLIRSLIQRGFCKNVYKAKILIRGKSNKSLIWTLCQEVMSEHLVLLNRAPTLHRLGVQAFLPILVSGRAILLHPLVCTGFNADFDGDQMGVHVPLFPQARAEAWKMMWSRNNFLLPSSGEPVLLPSQDMVLGCYYLTSYPVSSKSKTPKFLRIDENRSIIEKDANWSFRTKLSMFLLSWARSRYTAQKARAERGGSFGPYHHVLRTQSQPTFPIFNQSKTQSLFKTNTLLHLPNLLRISLDYFALNLRFLTQTDFELKANLINLSYLAFFPGWPNNGKIIETLRTGYTKQNISSHKNQLDQLSQEQTEYRAYEPIKKYLGDYSNYVKNKKSYFNILVFATKKQEDKDPLSFVNKQLTISINKPSQFHSLALFAQNNKEHAIIYTRVYNLKEKQTILKNKQETLSALSFADKPINITQKQLYFFSANASSFFITEKIPFWSYYSKHQTTRPKIGLIQWAYSPRFYGKCQEMTNETFSCKGFLKNKLTVSLLEKGTFLKMRGLGTSYAATNTKVLYERIYNRKKESCAQETNTTPFQILTVKTALNLYRKGKSGIQNIVWIHPTPLFQQKYGTFKQSFVETMSKTSSTKLESQKLESDETTTTLELRINPFGKMRLLHPSGIKTFTFQNSLLVPFKEPLKDPILDTFIRTTIGRLIFNNLLEDIENS